MKPTPPRKRNSETTREEILRQAVICFAGDVYDRVGVRQVAAAAGVDPALVLRYFGSKDRLYIEAIKRAQEPDERLYALAGDPRTMGLRYANALTSPEVRDRLMLTLRAAASPDGAPLISNMLQEVYSKPIEAVIEGGETRLRADLVNAVLLGAAVAYWNLEFDSMHGENVDHFIELTGRLVQLLIDDLEPAS